MCHNHRAEVIWTNVQQKLFNMYISLIRFFLCTVICCKLNCFEQRYNVIKSVFVVIVLQNKNTIHCCKPRQQIQIRYFTWKNKRAFVMFCHKLHKL